MYHQVLRWTTLPNDVRNARDRIAGIKDHGKIKTITELELNKQNTIGSIIIISLRSFSLSVQWRWHYMPLAINNEIPE